MTTSETHRIESLTSAERGRRAALASMAGGILEFYDFAIYASAAALVFGPVFFPGGGAAATLSSLATFGVAYIVRPFGALVLSHFGDRIGRRRIVLITLGLMGGCTFLVGCLPTYGQVGLLAPALLVLLRIGQGLSVAGEVSGVSSLTIEQAPVGRRGLYASWSTSGASIGFILASLVFIPIASLPAEQLLSWGWRVPFLLSAILTVVGYLLRRRLQEADAFTATQEFEERPKVPILEVVRAQPGDLARLVVASLVFALNTIVPVFGLSYATTTVGLSRSAMLWVTVLANVVAFAAIPMAAHLSDRIGRKPVYVVGALGSAAATFLYFGAISTANLPLVFLAGILLSGVFFSGCNGIYPSFFAETFPTRRRFTGMAVSLQLGLVVSGVAPIVAAALVGADPANWLPAALLGGGLAVVAAIAALTARETARTPLGELGGPN